jgi:hypothetical protein
LRKLISSLVFIKPYYRPYMCATCPAGSEAQPKVYTTTFAPVDKYTY